MTTVTVVIPTRDRWSFVRGAIAAATGQEGVDVEVIVVDDGSRDETPAGLAELKEPRVRALRNERPLGVAAARNRGIAEAGGEWVACLDDDDLWSPRKLAVQLEAAGAAGAGWAYCAAIVVDVRRRPLRMSISPPDPERVAVQLLRRNVIPAGSSNVVARTALMREIGMFDERLPQLADWDCWLRLAAAAPAAASRDVMVAYTQHPGNMLLQDSKELMRELDYIAEKHRARADEAGVEFDRLAISRWIAWAQRRAGRRRQAMATYLRGALAYRSPGNVPRALAAGISERLMRGPESPPDMPLREPDWLARYA